MAYSLPPLAYDYTALEPVLDAKTLEVHHSKHHQSYVNKVNAAIEGNAELESKSIEDLLSSLNSVPENIRQAVRNNGGGHANHSLYWSVIGPNAGGEPAGKLAEAIVKDFGNVDAFKEKFENAAKTQFGSGWAWLHVNDGKLCVCSTPNHDSPIMDVSSCRGTPLLVIDVWEHAYYLNYQNRRPDYVAAFWKIVNWDAVAEKYAKAIG